MDVCLFCPTVCNCGLAGWCRCRWLRGCYCLARLSTRPSQSSTHWTRTPTKTAPSSCSCFGTTSQWVVHSAVSFSGMAGPLLYFRSPFLGAVVHQLHFLLENEYMDAWIKVYFVQDNCCFVGRFLHWTSILSSLPEKGTKVAGTHNHFPSWFHWDEVDNKSC